MSNYTTATFFAICLAVFSVSASGQETQQSPFQSPRPQTNTDGPAVEQPSPLDSFEFNGIMKIGGETRISVYDTQAKRNYWLEQGEAVESGLILQRFDSDNETIVIARGGVMKKLSLKQVQIEPLRITTEPAVATTAPAPQGATARPSGTVSESDEEVRERMQRVAEEIRRRRAERRQRIEERREAATQ